MDTGLLEILACPICKGKLQLDNTQNELICRIDKLAYPIELGIPVMLENKARLLTDSDLDQ